MKSIIQLPVASATSTINTALENYNKVTPKNVYTNSENSYVELSPAVVNYKRSATTGKKPRAVVMAEKESASARFRSQMQEARVVLARELYSEEKKSLAQLRLSRGLSQTQLARAIGTSQSHIAKMEAGHINLYWDTVKRLAGALGVSLDEIRVILDSAASKQG